MNTTRNLIATVIVLAITSTSFAQFVDFSGQTADDPTWTVNAFGGIMTASFSSSFASDTVRWEPQTKSFTDPAFVQMFGESGSLITLVAQDDQSTASTTATLVFSSPLPIDAKLVVFDLDGASERIAISSNDGSILTPTEMESNDPNTSPQGASAFALWSQNQQRLLSTDTKNNDREAYVFNVSGVSHLELVMTAGEAAANWIGLAQPVVVPEPGSFAMVLIGIVALGFRRRRS
jgi:hypothetical protein